MCLPAAAASSAGLVMEPVRERADDYINIITFQRVAVVGYEIYVGVSDPAKKRQHPP